jgi:transcription elongation factor GreA
VGKRVGDIATIVTPNGKRELEILKVTTIHDDAGEGGQANGATEPGTEQQQGRLE